MRRRHFTPDRPSHEAVRPTLPFGVARTQGWSSNPRDHIAIYRPNCAIAGCREPAMVWSRCSCREVFAGCHNHPDQAAVLRAAHRCP